MALETKFSALGISSDEKAFLRHWGVLVSDLTLLDAQVVLQRTRSLEPTDTALGALYELCVENGKYTNVNIIRPLGMATIRKDWGAFSVEFIGTTEWSHDDIKNEGKHPI